MASRKYISETLRSDKIKLAYLHHKTFWLKKDWLGSHILKGLVWKQIQLLIFCIHFLRPLVWYTDRCQAGSRILIVVWFFSPKEQRYWWIWQVPATVTHLLRLPYPDLSKPAHKGNLDLGVRSPVGFSQIYLCWLMGYTDLCSPWETTNMNRLIYLVRIQSISTHLLTWYLKIPKASEQ